MQRTLAALAFAVVGSSLFWLLLSSTFESPESAGALGFFAGLASTVVFFVAQLIIRPPAVEGPSEDTSTPLDWGPFGPAAIVIAMTSLHLTMIFITQATIDGFSHVLRQPSVTTERMYTHLLMQIAGYSSFIAQVGLCAFALLLGACARRVQFWYFLVATLLPNLVLFLPRVIAIDPANISARDLLEAATGWSLPPAQENGPYAELAIVAVQLGILIASLVGVSLVWWLLALVGRWLARALNKGETRRAASVREATT